MKPPYPAPVTEWHNDTYDAIDPKRPELSQTGKKIVITGAGSGIGREVAHAFAEAGADSIHILGRTKRTLDETKELIRVKWPKAKIIVYVADILDVQELEQAAKAIGLWDVLVANAGYMPKPNLIETSDPDDWWKAFEVLPRFEASMLYQRLT
jgi:NADP-dependent 3-hydroxy acid dehydrogenase YdfG